MRTRVLLLVLLLAPLAGWAQGIPPSQFPPGAGFVWERVGTTGVNAKALAFAPDGALWGGGAGVIARLPPPIGPDGVWDNRNEFINVEALFVLGAGPTGDTLLITTGTTRRSVDGGRTFAVVHDGGRAAIVEGPAGRLLVGTATVARSDDRGATWTEADAFPPNAATDGMIALPPEPGRERWHVLSGVPLEGVAVSADSGRTFAPSGLWDGAHSLHAFAAVARPGGPAGALQVIGAGRTSAQPYARVWRSDDGGLTWQGPALLADVDDGGVSYERMGAVLPLRGSSALVVLGRGAIHRTDDGGATWTVIGRAPIEGETAAEIEDTYATDAVIGPDGRLYVSLLRIGCCYKAGVWRTAAPVIVAGEEDPEAAMDGLSLTVVPNPAADTAALVLTLPRSAASVRVALYDALGREVALVHDGPLGAGTHRLALDASSLAPGVYVARAVAEDGAVTTRLTLTR